MTPSSTPSNAESSLKAPAMEDPSVYLDDPNRKLLEIDTETRQGPALFRWLTLGMEYLIGAILVALIVAVSSNVVGRSLFNHSLPWVDELARMLFIWLVFIGAAMTCFPIFFAVIENDLRRVLAYSMINQIGFMICGIGIGTALAVNGAVSHAFNDIIFKGLLFMTMGAVLHMTGRMNGSDLGGLYKSMPKTATLCIIGAASISAFPLFSGFVSKSMVMSAALEEGYHWVWLMLLFASAGVFHHAGIKIPYFAFFAHDSGIRTSEPPANMLLAMTISAVLCIIIGVYPGWLYSLLPFDTGYNPYDATHVLAQTQLLFFSALAFVWLNLRGLYPPELHSVNLDAEWTYRRLFPKVIGNCLSWMRKDYFNFLSRTSKTNPIIFKRKYAGVEEKLSWSGKYESSRHGLRGEWSRRVQNG